MKLETIANWITAHKLITSALAGLAILLAKNTVNPASSNLDSCGYPVGSTGVNNPMSNSDLRQIAMGLQPAPQSCDELKKIITDLAAKGAATARPPFATNGSDIYYPFQNAIAAYNRQHCCGRVSLSYPPKGDSSDVHFYPDVAAPIGGSSHVGGGGGGASGLGYVGGEIVITDYPGVVAVQTGSGCLDAKTGKVGPCPGARPAS